MEEKIEEFLDWLEEMTDYGDWDQSIKDQVKLKLLQILK